MKFFLIQFSIQFNFICNQGITFQSSLKTINVLLKTNLNTLVLLKTTITFRSSLTVKSNLKNKSVYISAKVSNNTVSQ